MTLNFLSFLGNFLLSNELFIGSSMILHFVGDLDLSVKCSHWFISSYSSSVTLPHIVRATPKSTRGIPRAGSTRRHGGYG
jgi:hypothetical protein